MVDVSGQSCTISSTPDGVNADGGEIANGTENLMIKCTCETKSGGTPQRTRWFYPNTTRILGSGGTPPCDPYFSSSRNSGMATLFIPTFSNFTSGTYTCGINNDHPPPGMVTINLILLPSGKD